MINFCLLIVQLCISMIISDDLESFYLDEKEVSEIQTELNSISTSGKVTRFNKFRYQILYKFYQIWRRNPLLNLVTFWRKGPRLVALAHPSTLDVAKGFTVWPDCWLKSGHSVTNSISKGHNCFKLKEDALKVLRDEKRVRMTRLLKLILA